MSAQHNMHGRPRLPTVVTKQTTVGISGILGSLLLHALLLAPVLLGGHRHQHHQPQTQGSSASQQREKSLESMLVVFMEDSLAISDHQESEDSVMHRFLMPEPVMSSVPHPTISVADLNLTDALDERNASEANGDQTGHSMLFGRYMGQIAARVERAWMRPRSVPPRGSFACRVQITQDLHGNVQEITLQKCTDDPQWQMSLARAINAVSPLPAPPDPAVFSNVLTMQFDSDPYVAGASEDGFEPPAHPKIAH